jgi:asparagine synthase (glutamine-hydrolysing)
MCGICGIVDAERKINPDLLERMTQIMVHRGPDAGGTWINTDGTVGLGNRRLAIIDLDARSNMPLHSNDGSLVITYNGEIFNFMEIRQDLESCGHRFRTNSDTEVILHGYQEWGYDCVHKFRGMFAWALYDQPKRRLWLVRDRFGVKPLLYYQKGSLFAFASELQQFSQSGGFDTELDITALFDCLTYLYIPTPKTAFRHIRKLDAGHWMILEDGRIKIEKYWDLEEFGTNVVDEATAVKRLRDRLDEVIKLRLVSDVPVGVLLSGGLDSSCVTWYSQKNHNGPLKTFSIGFEEEANNELEYANEVARLVGSEHITKIYRLDAAITDSRKVKFLYGEPHGDQSIFPTTVVSRMAREHVKVVLSGDGGDELFWGYTRHVEYPRFNDSGGVPLKPLCARAVLHLMPMLMRGRYYLLRYFTRNFDLWTVLLDGFLRADKWRLVSDDVRDAVRQYDDYWLFRRFWKPELPVATRLQYLDFKTYLADDILMKVDRASMSVSLELREPLLDNKLAQEVFSWPDSVRNDGKTLKYIFKKALTDILPERILTKRKQGFAMPWKAWIKGWDEFRALQGDGRFFRKEIALPPDYTILVIQKWLNEGL